MHILSAKKNVFVLCSLVNDWNYFWNEYCNLPFLAIFRSQLPLFLLRHPDIKEQKLGCEWACEIKKKIINCHINHIKGLYKTNCYKTKSNISQFSFPHWLLHKCFFLFLYQCVCKFWKIFKISSTNFHCI